MASEPPDLMERLKESLQPTPEMLRRRLDAANAEVLALREVVKRVVTLCDHYEDRMREWDARYVAQRIRAEVAHILPAPTEEAGRG